MSAPTPADSGCTGVPNPQRVLVVDDDAMNLRFAARLLRELGYSGALANDGQKALRLIDEQSFDLVLLDINMPGMNGQDTLMALRARPGKRLPVLMVTGHGDDDTRRHFSDLGADGLLVKPLAAAPLRQAIARTTGL
jgi:CheY-like chemotaxis protein